MFVQELILEALSSLLLSSEILNLENSLGSGEVKLGIGVALYSFLLG